MAARGSRRGRTLLATAMLATGSALLAAAAFGQAHAGPHEGGTLRMDRVADPGFVDPALDYGDIWGIEGATCLKLLNYPFRNVQGIELIPEAASAMPTVSRSGRSYTFTVPPGRFRFNTGEPVTAKTFAFVINRDLTPRLSSPAASFLHDVEGADDVLSGKAETASGVQVHGDALSIRLTKVAPDFLARLAMPFFCALTEGTPAPRRGITPPIPAAGPYFISSWTPGRSLIVERNPYYQGPRPHHVDRIVQTIGVPISAQVLRVEKSETDIGSFPPTAVNRLIRTYGVNKGRFFSKPYPWLVYMSFNLSQPLFQDIRLRRAVNYALDRRSLARQLGPATGAPTDQILPPSLPGFHDWHLFPREKPDLRTARGLARDHAGEKVRLWTFNVPVWSALAQIVQRDLERIGFDVEVTLLSGAVAGDRAGRRGAPFDLFLHAWGADYLDPYDFINVLFDGRRIAAEHNVNTSYFDVPSWNVRMERASQLSGDARLKAYGRLDRDLMKQVVPVAPIASLKDQFFVSARVGCITYVVGLDLAGLCLN